MTVMTPPHGAPAEEMRQREQMIDEMLRRIPIDRAQRTLYKLAIDDPGGRVSMGIARKKLGFTASQFASALAALSKRINATPVASRLKPGLKLAFTTIGGGDSGVLTATPALLRVLGRIPLLREELSKGWASVLSAERLRVGDADRGDVEAEHDADLGSAGPLHGRTVLHALGEARINGGRYQTKQRWTAAREAWDEACAAGFALPILFGEAAVDSGNLFRWAVVTRLDVDEGGTEIEWREIRRVRGKPDVTQLVRAKDGQRFDRNVRKLYSVVNTPRFLIEAARVRSAPGVAPLIDVESDPIQFELVQRRMRRHQSQFRDVIMAAYRGRCAVTGCDVAEVLEAAHIDPHVENGDNSSENGLLLRSDVHALFDLGLLRVHPQTLAVKLDASVLRSAYAEYEGHRLAERTDGRSPNLKALEVRWRTR